MNHSQVQVSTRIKQKLVTFIDTLRSAEFTISSSNIQLCHEVICTPVIENQQALKFALRSVLCDSKDQWLAFNDLFDAHWLPANGKPDQSDLANDPTTRRGSQTTGLGYFSETLAQNAADTPDTEFEAEIAGGGASDARVLAERDFRFVFDARHMRQIEQSVDVLARQIQKRTRRRTRSAHRKGRLDLRQTSRRSLRHDGWCFDLRYKKARKSPARFLLLLDVSQSMEVYSYLFLRFARVLLTAFRDTDAFAFHTDLVSIGAELKEKNSARLERKLKDLSSGWLGGTRIAESLHDFNNSHAAASVNRHTIVLVFSDGYDSSEPEYLRDEVLRIKQRCRKLVWVNPLLGRDTGEDYDLPIERGMKLVVPILDMYASAHSLQSLQQLAPAFSYR